MNNGIFNLADLDGNNGFVIRGIDDYDRSGRSVSSAGDFNGDGIDDLIIGASGASGSFGDATKGSSYVVFGSNEGFDEILELSDLDGTNGFVLRGVSNGDLSGLSVSGAGDINGDGFDDIIIGAPYADLSADNSREGESYVVFGSNEVFDAALELSDLDGNNGFILRGINSRDQSGRSVSGIGDINGDGIDDIIIGAPYANLSGNYTYEGESYVVYGNTDGFNAVIELSDLDGTNGFFIRGADREDSSGFSVSSAGDVNGDGIADLIIGARFASVGSNYEKEGESYVVFGSNDGFDTVIELSDLDGSNGFVLQGVDRGDDSGFSVSGAGDINGDGFDDIIIGAPDASIVDTNSNEGKSYVVFGSNGGFDAAIKLSDLDGTNGFVLEGVDPNDFSGDFVSSAGDINGDGFDEIIIGAPNADVSTTYSTEGESYVIFGGNDGFDAVIELSDLDGNNGFVFRGIDNQDRLGNSVSSAGDINGDGVDDLVIGAPGVDVDGNDNQEGETYVIFGVKPLNITGTNNNDFLKGGNSNDTISGLRGKDTIDGLGGNDTIAGGLGKDTIDGGKGDDQIRGGFNADNLFGDQGNDTIYGGFGRDTINGGDGDDDIKGNSGADEITGGAGNDLLYGGVGQDTLTGVDPSVFGVGEIDTLQGGAGKDVFVLGNADSVFYDDGDALTTGENDFALVKDFNQRRDVIELQGDLDLYHLEFVSSGTGSTNAEILYTPGNAAIGELIAVLENVSEDLSLSDINFRFVV